MLSRIRKKISGAISTERVTDAAKEFQPDAIYLENQGPGFPLHIVWYILLAILIFGLVWASISEVDKVIVAEGKIVTVRPPMTIKPFDNTVIKKVWVKVGQRVKNGDILFEFDPTMTKADLDRLTEQYASMNAQRQRLNAENNSKIFEYDPQKDASGDMRLQKMIFDARHNYFTEKMQSYNENIIKTENIVKALERSKGRYDDRQDKVRKIESMMDDLNRRKVISTKEFLETQISVIGMDVQIDDLEMKTMEYSHQLMIMRAERNSFTTDWKKNLVEELVKVDRDCISLEREISKAKMLASLVELKSPCDAVVHEIAPFQEGSAVRSGESLITLIPLDVPMEAEVNILAKDIGLVKLGDFAKIKFDAYPFQQNGTLDGHVRYISQDAFEKGQNNAELNPRKAAEQKGSFYQVSLDLSGHFKKPENKVLPGMRVVAEVIIGKRKVISYLINPFIKAMDDSLNEP